jgi:tRNA A-37 threonylcarbamoyl transferase component Bud32
LKSLTQQEYLAMCEGAEVLEADPHGDKVLRLADGSILKLFRRKRLLSSALLYPYARRFQHNALALARMGIPVPTVLSVMRIPEMARDCVHYRPLPGVTMRQVVARGVSPERRQELRRALTRLIIRLHDHGVYFRSLHIGNVIVTPEGQLGLIDFSDMRIYPWSLGKYLRKRNMQRMYKVAGEPDWVDMDAVIAGDAG